MLLLDRPRQVLVRRFGSGRGLVRLAVANGLWLFGPYRRYRRVDFNKVRRLVFVCQGNVCRSPFAHHLAQQRIATVPVVSFGLVAASGQPADALAVDVAREFGVDLLAHRTTSVADFPIRPGDLLLAMEARQLRELEPLLHGRDVQIGLLGLWRRTPLGLIYDPHRLTRDYFSVCFKRISEAVEGLREALESCSQGDTEVVPASSSGREKRAGSSHQKQFGRSG